MKCARVALSVLASCTVVLSCGNDSGALTSCSNTQVVGVRGSGQTYGHSGEVNTVRNLLPHGVGFDELSNKIDFLKGLSDYTAIKVAENNFPNADGLGAIAVSRMNLGQYRKSVDSGKNLLKKYIEHFQPTNTCLVLVGYSQGAQVVNETVRDMHAANPSSLDNVIYVGLLGDPMNSPIGYDGDHTFRPSWVRGTSLYPSYGALYTDIATPISKKPDYIPANPNNPRTPFTKVGSWCNYGDLVCATDVVHRASMQDGHAAYSEDGIPDMVLEIRAAIANPDQNITNAIYPSSECGAAKQDMILLLDTSAYMRRNKDLFTSEKNTWDKKTIRLDNGTVISLHRTFGEQLFDSGCVDKRIAVVGFEGPNSGAPPRLLLNFTTRASDIDNLMESLYQPSEGGVAERPQVREAAILAMKQNWRPDASHTLFAITAMAGSGDVVAGWRDTWSTPEVVDRYMGDTVGKEFIRMSRETNTAFIFAPSLPISMTGFTVSNSYPGDTNAYWYLRTMSSLSGGYNWEKTFVTYPIRHTIKNINFSEEIRQHEVRRDGTRVGMSNVKVKVGQSVAIDVRDSLNLLASAGLRGHGTAREWYVDCDAMHKRIADPVVANTNGRFIFTPTKPGKCTAAVRVATQGSGAGCYYGCPEIFPPYMSKMVSFQLEILPADYVEKIPSKIPSFAKTIYDNHVKITWEAPIYDGDKIFYIVRDEERSVLGMTTARELVIKDTEKQDVDVIVQAVGVDGRSEAAYTSGDTTIVIDERIRPVSSRGNGSGPVTVGITDDGPRVNEEQPPRESADMVAVVGSEFENHETQYVLGSGTARRADEGNRVNEQMGSFGTVHRDVSVDRNRVQDSAWWLLALSAPVGVLSLYLAARAFRR